MEFLAFSLGLLLGSTVVCCVSVLPDYLARRKVQKKIKAVDERNEFKREVTIMARCMVLDEIGQCKREMVSYIDTKLAEKDKQEESENV